MKKNMSTFIIIIIAAAILYLALFNKPQHPSEAELQKWFSSKLSDIAASLEADIRKDKEGEYPHAGKQTFEKRGKIVYVLRDKNNSRFDISDKNTLSMQDIIETEGYRKLDAKVRALGLSVHLREKDVEGDGVNTFNELDEYVDDFPRYYTVTIDGW